MSMMVEVTPSAHYLPNASVLSKLEAPIACVFRISTVSKVTLANCLDLTFGKRPTVL